MDAATCHRGPDGTHDLVRDGITLGHNRLSILDVSAAADQPMVSSDGRFAIVYNGELYNFKELRRELRGYAFRSAGDTEVVLAAYAQWGTGAFARMNGIFAVAIHDRQEKSLILARDPMGVKPLYYAWDEKERKLIFSSEMKALFEAGVSRTLDTDAFDAYVRLLYVPGPATAIAGVKKLPPGSYGIYENGAFEIQAYASPPARPEPMTFSDAAERVESAVDQAIARQLVSDRPLGLYLSGGVDSTVILDSASRLRPGIDTFSVGFSLAQDEEPEKFNADSLLAAKTAKLYGSTHHSFLITPEEILPAFTAAVRQMDEPVSNPTTIPMFLLAKRVKEAGIDVALSGDGGDELFGGYERYRWARRADLWQMLPRAVRHAAGRCLPALKKLEDAPGIERYARFHFQKEAIVREIMGGAYRSGDRTKERFAEACIDDEGVDPLTAFMRADRCSWLVDESLLKADKLSMAHSLEVRVPLLDLELVALADRIPSAYKAGAFHTKKILKEAFRHRLPSYLFKEPKRGWQSPGAKWLRYPHIAAFAEEALSPGYHTETDALFDWEAVARMLNEHRTQDRYNLVMLWALLTFRVWAREYDIKL